MELLFFLGLNPKGHYQEHSFGEEDVESCSEVLNILVDAGWHINSRSTEVLPRLYNYTSNHGIRRSVHFRINKILQRDWEELLQLKHP